MSLWARPQKRVSKVTGPEVPPRGGSGRGVVAVTPDTALRHSAVWACLRIRADLISTFPVDVFRKFGDIDIEMPKSPVLINPDGQAWPYMHWMWASQFDVDRVGNTVGLIVEKNALGLPSRIELQPGPVSIYKLKGWDTHRYRIDGKEYMPEKVWHERQFPVPGLPVGLSPVAIAAWSLSESLSMQQFALDWFGGGGVPKARLHNTKRSLDGPGVSNTTEARRVKDRYMATVANGEVFVHGNDWELDFIQAQAMGKEWLEGRQFGITEAARYFGCPVDLIEAAISAPGSITYQSALQRNLQLLVINLNAAIIRRETALSTLLPRPRVVKLNTNSLLRMDPETQAKVIKTRIESRTLTPSQARKYYNEPPLTSEDIAEFDRLFGPPRAPSTQQPAKSEPEGREQLYEQVSPLSVVPYPSDSTLERL